MGALQDSDHVHTILRRLEPSFDVQPLKVNAAELPMVRTPDEDTRHGKQLLLLLAPRPEKLAAEFRTLKQQRFEREGNPLLLQQPYPTSAEALQICDKLIRRPRRLGASRGARADSAASVGRR